MAFYAPLSAKLDVEALCEHLRGGKEAVLFDLETTGLSPVKDRILSFSALKVAYENNVLKAVHSGELFMNPGFPIPPAVTKVNHISDDRVKDCPLETAGIPLIKKFMGESPIVIGYNSKRFDVPFLNAAYERVLGESLSVLCHVDVFLMAKEKLNLKTYKLEAVANELGADVGIEFHNSVDDCKATFRVFKILLDSYFDSKQEPERTVAVKAAHYWSGPSHSLKRIYVKTYPYVGKVYYDVVKKKWIAEDDALNMDHLRNEVLSKLQCENEKELLFTLTKNQL